MVTEGINELDKVSNIGNSVAIRDIFSFLLKYAFNKWGELYDRYIGWIVLALIFLIAFTIGGIGIAGEIKRILREN